MTKFTGIYIKRIDVLDKVTGKALYPGDLNLENTLNIKLIRSTRAHALIKNIDASGLEGIKDLYYFSAGDLYENTHGSIIKDQPVFADKKVNFYGEAIAAIATYNKEKLDEYASLVKVEYEDLDVIDDPVTAIEDYSEKIHKDGNLLQYMSFEKGNIEMGFKDSRLILEDDFELPVVDHMYLETESGVSYIDENGVMNLIVGTQNPFYDKSEIVRCLNIPEDKLIVKAGTVGGGFGGKDGNTIQLFLALVTWKTGKAARLVFNREESLTASYKRHAAKIHLKMGFSQDGIINAFESKLYFDTGAYAALGPATLGLGIEHSTGPYIIKNVKLDGYLSYTNKAPASAMRGFGAPQVEFATETFLNKASKILNIDPLEIRYKNALYNGAEASLGHTMEHAVGIKQALSILKDSKLWREKTLNKDPYIGYGLAAGYLSCGMGKGIVDSAKVEIEQTDANNYKVKIGTVEIGQGSSTLFAQIAAEELGVALDEIEIIMSDTSQTFNCGSTAGSRTGYICGNAIISAVEDFKAQKQKGIKYPKGIGESDFPEVRKIDMGSLGVPHAMYTFIAQAVKVKVDPFTGQIDILDIFAVTEAGRILNPLSLDGQIHGGMAMGLGYTLMEEIEYDNGIPRQKTLSSYLIPTSLDIPSMTSETVDSFELSGPKGLKGAAEVSSVSIAPAITAAVNQLVPIDFKKLPISRHSILEFYEGVKLWD